MGQKRYNTYAMVFKRISSIHPVAAYLAASIVHSLEMDNRTLWLIPGGSGIAVAAAACKLLEGEDLHNLTVMLTDERFGPVGHKDSNWQQLQATGFALPGARLVPVLVGKDRATTTAAFENSLKMFMDYTEYRLGFFGIGDDGHTAGILPGSPAVQAETLAASYAAGVFERITMTPKAISRLDEAIVYAVGEIKWPVLDALETEVPLTKQPAQALKTVPNLTIFNDHKGEEE
jgi:6-phosphogluconolactonase/glucosamine-6-phosphate isomerase/deaminase